MQYDIVLFRRNLRLEDNAVLARAIQESNKPLLPVFIFDKYILDRFNNPRDRRISFLMHTLKSLDEELEKKYSSKFLVLSGYSTQIIPKLAEILGSEYIFSGRDHEKSCIQRDAEIQRRLPENVEMSYYTDHLLKTPDSITKPDNSPYKVFTPYMKAYSKALGREEYLPFTYSLKNKLSGPLDKATLEKIQQEAATVIELSKPLSNAIKQTGYIETEFEHFPVNEAGNRLENFIQEKAADYDNARNFLADNGTSRISPYLRFGLISIRKCYSLGFEAETSQWINELIWREFYAMILYYFPESASQEFLPQFRNFPWGYDEECFELFKQGRTGFPIVDAAMRQLLREGWMHNRARMIVASFLTKDLLIDWRWGEEHFAQHLLDYELSSNVGGWQWAASTGTDAQPYFRIFNPTRQAERFDPEGRYIRRYVPELREAKLEHILDPYKMAAAGATPKNYPAPMIDHKLAKDKTLAIFSRLKNS